MLHVYFNLRKEKQNQKGLAPVRMIITHGSKKIRKVVPSVKVMPKYWSNQRIKPNLKSEPYNYHVEFNMILDDIDRKIRHIYRESLLTGKPITKDYILQRLDGKPTSMARIDFVDALDEFVATHRSVRAASTIKKYRSTIQFIKDFAEARSFELFFESIDIKFIEAFRDYAFLERHTLNNYYGKLIAFVKTFMNWALDRGYHNNLEFKKFKRTAEDIEVIYLTMDELLSLYHFDFNSRRLSMVRDLYCFGCFTGLRFSDLKALRPAHVFEDHLRMTLHKTRSTDHKIPLNKMAKEILERYQGTVYEPIPRISGQKFNEYIKECCERVGIDELICTTRYIGQRRVDQTRPKYELITSHTARKTFVTNSLILGMNERVLKNITGHKDDASFKRYVDIAENFKQREMSNTWDKI
ncbi:site-specific integrase [Flagellimonas beolgyonensis]|uniref:site-specific integrase n=1 Tax=Flagellimonas beolgyonensis TaxID=864064 RepID=UPI000F8CFE50|nr:site-specific integrase [Allomuricauda beolgyonensis]